MLEHGRVNGIQDGGDDHKEADGAAEEEDRGLNGLREANWRSWATEGR